MSRPFIALGSLLTVSTINLASSLPVSAQIRAAESIDSVRAPITKIAPEAVRVNRRTPVRFEAFQLKNPETGAAISSDAMLTLPDGKQVKAGEYYAELNRFEQEFSQLGYSLRQPEDEVTLQESLIDQGSLREQIEVSSKNHFQLRPEQTLMRSALEPQQALVDLQKAPSLQVRPGALQHLQVNPQLIAPDKLPQLRLQSIDLDQPAVQVQPGLLSSVRSTSLIKPDAILTAPLATASAISPKTYTKNWNISAGSKSTFSAYLNGKLQIIGHPNFTSAYAEGNAGGYVFNNKVNLLRATAIVNSPKAGNGAVSLQLNALGQTVYNFQDSKNTLLVKSDTFSKSYDRTVADVRFSVGPIPMRATFGVKGSAGMSYFVIANPMVGGGYAKVNPFVDTRAYGQGGADIVVGGAGVGANLVLLKNDLDIRGNASLGLENGKPYLLTQLSAYNELSALNGNAYAYAYVYVPKFGIPPWKKKQWNWNIFSWSGLKTDGYLFDESHKSYF
jgi:hypothetical protein